MAWSDEQGRTYRDHRDIVDESRFKLWIICNTKRDMIMCPHCFESIPVYLPRLLASQEGTDLRPCVYCFRSSLIRPVAPRAPLC